MKKIQAENQLQEAIMKNETGVFLGPIAPIDCPTFDKETANYVRKGLELYLKTWVFPKLDAS